MVQVETKIEELKENLEKIAFLVSKGGAEREAHGKVVESLVILSQLETVILNGSSNQSNSNNTKTYNEKEKIDYEVEKVTRKLPRWFKNPSQNNSTILFNYLKLSEQSQDANVSLQALKRTCNSVRDFYNNYSQMKNFGEKNHGKVFEESDGYVTLWGPVREFILQLYNKNKV
ncbi:MAG: hypothetical protein K9L30_02545 [Desulfobacterales bacterium]|nr:hypothetical protein [Desulfobacterales bacterium]